MAIHDPDFFKKQLEEFQKDFYEVLSAMDYYCTMINMLIEHERTVIVTSDKERYGLQSIAGFIRERGDDLNERLMALGTHIGPDNILERTGLHPPRQDV